MRRGFSIIAFGAMLGSVALHLFYLAGGMKRAGPILFGMYFGVFILGIPAIFVCTRLAEHGVRGRAEQWRYVKSHCPHRLSRAVGLLAVYALLWVLRDIALLNLGHSSADASVGTVTASMMAIYGLLGMIFVGTKPDPAGYRSEWVV